MLLYQICLTICLRLFGNTLKSIFSSRFMELSTQLPNNSFDLSNDLKATIKCILCLFYQIVRVLQFYADSMQELIKLFFQTLITFCKNHYTNLSMILMA